MLSTTIEDAPEPLRPDDPFEQFTPEVQRVLGQLRPVWPLIDWAVDMSDEGVPMGVFWAPEGGLGGAVVINVIFGLNAVLGGWTCQLGSDPGVPRTLAFGVSLGDALQRLSEAILIRAGAVIGEIMRPVAEVPPARSVGLLGASC